MELIKYVFSKTPIKVLSGRGMSTENRNKRPAAELEFLFGMYKTCGSLLNDFLKEQQINFRRIGDASSLPQDFLDYMESMVRDFSFDTDRYLIFAINYGGQNEIIRGVKNYVAQGNTIENLSEENLGEYMDLGAYPPVDLVIRTKGDTSSRISGFMSWWIGYAELYFESKLFQDVQTADLDKALEWYGNIAGSRNFGA